MADVVGIQTTLEDFKSATASVSHCVGSSLKVTKQYCVRKTSLLVTTCRSVREKFVIVTYPYREIVHG